jgi:hypothetical protein
MAHLAMRDAPLRLHHVESVDYRLVFWLSRRQLVRPSRVPLLRTGSFPKDRYRVLVMVCSRRPGGLIAPGVRALDANPVREDYFKKIGCEYGCSLTGVGFPEARKPGGRVKKHQQELMVAGTAV